MLVDKFFKKKKPDDKKEVSVENPELLEKDPTSIDFENEKLAKVLEQKKREEKQKTSKALTGVRSEIHR